MLGLTDSGIHDGNVFMRQTRDFSEDRIDSGKLAVISQAFVSITPTLALSVRALSSSNSQHSAEDKDVAFSFPLTCSTPHDQPGRAPTFCCVPKTARSVVSTSAPPLSVSSRICFCTSLPNRFTAFPTPDCFAEIVGSQALGLLAPSLRPSVCLPATGTLDRRTTIVGQDFAYVE